ncbi:MAG: nitrous oxide reductase family maturation protein NosD [Bacteroidetes bacterium]|nr:nitrous oxide reductase family maturation protein NosD [Bacteroidota bacterium]
MVKSLTCYFVLLLLCIGNLDAKQIHVGKNQAIKTIKAALVASGPRDTIMIHSGMYHEGNIEITQPLTIIGIDLPIIDGDRKFEVISIKSDSVTIKGLRVQHSGYATLDDPGGIKIYNGSHILIEENELFDNFFGIYILFGKKCHIKNNRIVAFGKTEDRIGNGIHAWKSDSLIIEGNDISGCRDGIYFEFVTHSLVWRNISYSNLRYGLHFMFSNNDSYITNIFKNNGAGVAVMFTKGVKMFNNTFIENWGDAAYGLLLKEISDSYIFNNKFIRNTSGIYMEGTNRITVEKNVFESNGWAMRIQASCMDNDVKLNNFIGNTFDIGTNGTLVLNNFDGNFWDKYEGYDLTRDGFGDVPYHPLSLFSVIVEQNPPAMLLYRSTMVSLLDKSEKVLPSLTPENFIDNKPRMRALPL